MKDSFLTDRQLKDFDLDGYLVIRSFYDANEMRNIGLWIDELSSRMDEKSLLMFYLEDSLLKKGQKILSRIEQFVEYHEEIRKVVFAPKLIDCVGQLIGDEAVLFKEKVNFKPSGGGGFKPHQDIQPGWDEYAPYFLSVLVTVDVSTEENGCLELAAGHHRSGMIGRKWQPLEGDELKGITFKKYPMRPGDVAFFDCFVPHRSEPNLTPVRRRNLYLTYNRKCDGDHRARYFADKRASFPPDKERDPKKTYSFKV